MGTFKRHRFKIVFSFVLCVTISLFAFLYCVHIPYIEHQTDLLTIRNRFLEENQYVYDDYFYQYNDNLTLYMIRVIKSDVSTYLVFDQYLNELDSFKYEEKGKDFVEEVFFTRYELECESIEIVYEDDRFVYFAKYSGEEGLIYAFYDLYSGQFIKSVQL